MTKHWAEMHLISSTRCCKKHGRVVLQIAGIGWRGKCDERLITTSRYQRRQNIFPLTQYLGYYRPVSCLAPTLFARVKALAAYSMFSIRYKYLSRNSHYSPFMCQQVKLSIQLSHCNGFGIQDKRVYLFIRGAGWRIFAFQCSQSFL